MGYYSWLNYNVNVFNLPLDILLTYEQTMFEKKFEIKGSMGKNKILEFGLERSISKNLEFFPNKENFKIASNILPGIFKVGDASLAIVFNLQRLWYPSVSSTVTQNFNSDFNSNIFVKFNFPFEIIQGNFNYESFVNKQGKDIFVLNNDVSYFRIKNLLLECKTYEDFIKRLKKRSNFILRFTFYFERT